MPGTSLTLYKSEPTLIRFPWFLDFKVVQSLRVMVAYTNKQTSGDYNIILIYKYIEADNISIMYSCNPTRL